MAKRGSYAWEGRQARIDAATDAAEAEMAEPEADIAYDYDAQVWTRDGIILPCGHTAEHHADHMCVAGTFAGLELAKVRKFFASVHDGAQ